MFDLATHLAKDKAWAKEKAKQMQKEEYENDECPACAGTGEGAYEGQSCNACRGNGAGGAFTGLTRRDYQRGAYGDEV